MAQIGYVTVEEANTYIKEHYMSTDPARIRWDALSDGDKVALLRTSFEAIELLPFSGHKSYKDQTTAFPRYPDTTVPPAVVAAQVENALASSDSSEVEEDQSYAKMRAWGIQSYSIGNLSETLGAGGSSAAAAAVDACTQAGITSVKAQRLLTPFLRGGYRIT